MHRELTLRPNAALLLPALADAFDEPFADSSALPTYLVSKLAAEDVKVALSGEGGDELFGGYYTYVADLLAERFGPVAARMRPLADRLPSSTRKASFDYRLKRFTRAAAMPPLERHHMYKEIFSADARAELTGRRSEFDPLIGYRERFAETEGHELLTRLQDVDFGLYLVDDLLTKTDRASMAWSLEARVPFMDTVVSNFAFSLPVKHKVRGFSKKRLLRKAMEPLLPHEIVHGKKRGFSIPAAAWLRGELEPFARETLSPETIRRQGFLQPDVVTRLIDDHVAGPRGPLAPALGAARVHALVRAARRARSPRRLIGECHRVKVWVDFTASAHPLVFRPLVELLRGAGSRGRDHRARLRADAAADRVARDDRDGDRPPRRPVGTRQGAADAHAAEGAAALGEGPRLRPRARPRLARADDDRAPARHPELDDVRLRVGVAAAPARLPGGDARRRAGRRSRRSA